VAWFDLVGKWPGQLDFELFNLTIDFRDLSAVNDEWVVPIRLVGSTASTGYVISGTSVHFLLGGGYKDTDGDGLPDECDAACQEAGFEEDLDDDGDGLSDLRELELGTEPLNPDTDADGLSDGEELEYGTDPKLGDTDSDGLSDKEELDGTTNPRDPDTDDDGIIDSEDQYPNDPANGTGEPIQRISVSPSGDVEITSAGETFSFVYSTSDGSTNAPGVGIRIYYNSSQLEDPKLSDDLTKNRFLLAFDPDSEDTDNDSSTDSVLNISWLSFSGGFTSEQSVELFKMRLSPTLAVADREKIKLNFGAEAAAGFAYQGPDLRLVYVTPPELSVPASITVEANGPNGVEDDGSSAALAIENFLRGASANDDVDGDLTSRIKVEPGFPFSLGETEVAFSVSDSAGNVSLATRTVTVVDTTSPIISGELTATFAALDANGRLASEPDVQAFIDQIAASDAVSGDVDIVLAAVPEVFPLGATSMEVSAKDAAGNEATATAVVTVADLTPPVITVQSMVIEASSSAGASITESEILANISITDNIDVELTAFFDGELPEYFGLGDHFVPVYAEDAAGNLGAEIVSIQVVDTTPPVINGNDLTLFFTQEEKESGKLVQAGDEVSVWAESITAEDAVVANVPVQYTLPTLIMWGPIAEGAAESTEVVFEASDGRNVSTLTLLIKPFSDAIPPVITAPEDLTVEATGPEGVADDGSSSANLISEFLTAAQASDDTDGDL